MPDSTTSRRRRSSRISTAPEVDGAPPVRAAGVVAFRPGRRVLLVHRPSYDDWSFPKGKLDRWEHSTAAAVREVAEETGLHVSLGPPLPLQRYSTGRRDKVVHYWAGRVVGDDDVSHYRPNAEIDQVAWVPVDEAADRLTYERDRNTLRRALKARRRTHAVVVLRHGAARSRRAWRGEERERPLLRTGETQAQRLVPMLGAYDVTRVVSSTSLRCRQTVGPYADTTGWEIETRRRLSEEDAKATAVSGIVADLLDDTRGSVLCTHRPVLPLVFEALGIDDRSLDRGLEAGEMLVAHVRKGAVVALERHRP